MAQETTFHCLRCGHRFRDVYTPGVTKERACPRCASNSVRRQEESMGKGK